jgi:flavin reductase (DIM6/NTAB) family NADH-FMN oxidoreductase RutF
MRVPVELRRSYKLINHGPTTLIASAARGRSNVMAAAWVMPIDFEPPLVAAVIASGTLTRELVDQSHEFTINLPTAAMVDAVYAVGKVSGHDVDKLEKYGLKTSPASRVSAPFIEGCAGWLECRVRSLPEMQAEFDLFIAEVLAAWADDRAFVDGEWRFAEESLRTLHHESQGIFMTTGERLVAREPAP